jgi:hypothetical protein
MHVHQSTTHRLLYGRVPQENLVQNIPGCILRATVTSLVDSSGGRILCHHGPCLYRPRRGTPLDVASKEVGRAKQAKCLEQRAPDSSSTRKLTIYHNVVIDGEFSGSYSRPIKSLKELKTPDKYRVFSIGIYCLFGSFFFSFWSFYFFCFFNFIYAFTVEVFCNKASTFTTSATKE